jgi:hypothetical protein
MTRGRALACASLAVAGGAVGLTSALADTGSDSPHTSRWRVGEQRGSWIADFDGYGTIGVEVTDLGRAIALAPLPSVTESETHAALVTSERVFGDVEFEVRVLTRRQLRRPKPNQWEVAWVLWDYTDNTHFSYVALKPNGWEIGQATPDGEGNQRIVATGDKPRFATGHWHTVRVRRVGQRTTLWADGRRVTSVTDPGAYGSGRIGLYTEDADTLFGAVRVTRPEAALLAPPSP